MVIFRSAQQLLHRNTEIQNCRSFIDSELFIQNNSKLSIKNKHTQVFIQNCLFRTNVKLKTKLEQKFKQTQTFIYPELPIKTSTQNCLSETNINIYLSSTFYTERILHKHSSIQNLHIKFSIRNSPKLSIQNRCRINNYLYKAVYPIIYKAFIYSQLSIQNRCRINICLSRSDNSKQIKQFLIQNTLSRRDYKIHLFSTF